MQTWITPNTDTFYAVTHANKHICKQEYTDQIIFCSDAVEKGVRKKISQNSQENICAGVSFLIKCQFSGL